MGYVALFVSFILLIVCIKDNINKMLMPKTLFFMLWTFILFLSNLNLYNIIKPSDEAYFLILLMIIFFFIGSYISKINVRKNKKPNSLLSINKKMNNFFLKIKKIYNNELKTMLIYLLFALFIIFTLIDCVIVVESLMDGIPMHTIRHWRMGTFGVDQNPILSRRTFLEEIFRNVVLNPFELAVPPYAAYCFFNPKEKAKKKYLILVLSLAVLLLSSLAGGGGRLGFIYYFGSFLIGFLYFYKVYDVKKKRKYIKTVFCLLLFGVIGTFLYTQVRTSAGFVKQFYTYFALPPTLLSIWLPKLDGVSNTFGLLTTFGIHSYFFRGLDAIGLDFLVPEIYDVTFQHLLNAEKFFQVGYGVGNAFVTPIYYFMIDGGYFFVCLASFIFGILTSKLYNGLMKKNNMRNFIIYCLILYGVFLTFMRIQTAIPTYIISFLIVFFLFDNREEECVCQK